MCPFGRNSKLLHFTFILVPQPVKTQTVLLRVDEVYQLGLELCILGLSLIHI